MNTQTTRILTAMASLLLAVPAMAETVFDNTHPSIVYSPGWNHESAQFNAVYGNASYDTLSETRTANASAGLTFSANRSISLVYTMGGNRWKTRVYIDGVLVDTLFNRTPQYNQRWMVMKTYSVSPGTHTIQVVAPGAIEGQDTHLSWSDVDAFIVDADAAYPNPTATYTSYPADYYLWMYGGNWNYVIDSVYGDRMQSQTIESSVRFTFSGTDVSLRYYAAANRGIAELTLDGQVIGDLDQYGPGEMRSHRLTGLAPGMHTLTMTVSGRKNASATNDIIGVTRVVLRP